MKNISLFLICVVALFWCNGTSADDLVDDLIEKLLKDPHSREIIEETQAKLDHQLPAKKDAEITKDSYPEIRGGDAKVRPPPSSALRGGDAKVRPPPSSALRGGDANIPPPSNIRGGDANVPPVVPSHIRDGDAKTEKSPSLDDLLNQLKSAIQDTLDHEKSTETKDNLLPPPPSHKDTVPLTETKRNAAKESRDPPLGFPWKDSQPQNNWIPWNKRSSSLNEKKALYKRVINDINELFAMATSDEKFNSDKLSLDLSSLDQKS